MATPDSTPARFQRWDTDGPFWPVPRLSADLSDHWSVTLTVAWQDAGRTALTNGDRLYFPVGANDGDFGTARGEAFAATLAILGGWDHLNQNVAPVPIPPWRGSPLHLQSHLIPKSLRPLFAAGEVTL